MADKLDYIEWKKWISEKFGHYNKMENVYYKKELSKCGINPSKSKILEIGFGNGSFIGWCKQNNYEIMGVETNELLVDRCNKYGVRSFNSLKSQEILKLNGYFSVIVGFNVLEHLEKTELSEFVLTVRNLLMKNGIFIASFPNGDSPFGRINQNGDLTHNSSIGRGTIEQLCSENNLELINLRQPARPLIGGGLLNMIYVLVSTPFRFALENIFRLIYFPKTKIPFDLNYIAVIRK